jgi:hypothetical protein
MIDDLKAAQGNRFCRLRRRCLDTSINKGAHGELGGDAPALRPTDAVGDSGDDYARGTVDPKNTDVVFIGVTRALLRAKPDLGRKPRSACTSTTFVCEGRCHGAQDPKRCNGVAMLKRKA